MDIRVHLMSRKEAIEITGGLSQTSKMPCPSWGIPTKYCKQGEKFAKHAGSVCEKCYAKRGPISWPAAVNKQEMRFEGIKHPQWVDAMTALILFEADNHFRWFDVGDLQGKKHLNDIVKIANNLPHIKFWLPTQEYNLVMRAKVDIPDNLIIRISSKMIDGDPYPKSKWSSVVKDKAAYTEGYHCPSSKQDNKCGACRACWDKETKLIVYKKH